MPSLWINDTPVSVEEFEPNRTLLEFLREDMKLPGTKEGCASGDCGACTVVLRDAAPEAAGPVPGERIRTANACITPLGAALGSQVLTVDALADGELHPVQDALVRHHASQCGYCTPGFVMSLVGHQLQTPSAAALRQCSRADLVRAISGNLCRCTGYRPILEAARDADATTALRFPNAAANAVPALCRGPKLSELATATDAGQPAYRRPTSEAELQALLREAADGYRLVAGATDLWLAVTQSYQDLGAIIDLGGIPSLAQVDIRDGRLRIGAAVSHERLRRFFGDQGALPCHAIASLMERFASPQIRQRGTLGGNIANASPIADWPPVLMVLDAVLEVADADGAVHRLPLRDFYLGYRRTRLEPGQYLRAVELDARIDWQALHVFKVSKRVEDDISSVLGAFYVVRRDDKLRDVRIAFGGMAATPVRLEALEDHLRGSAGSAADVNTALTLLAGSLTPISDVRASAAYRMAMAGALLSKALAAAAGDAPRTLEEALA